MNRRHSSAHVGSYLIVLLFLLFCVFPIFWMLMSSFKTAGEINQSPPVWIPHHFDTAYYGALFQNGSMDSLLNSVIIACGNTLVSLIIGLPAAYSLARWKTGGNNLGFWFLSMRMLPPVVLVVPVFMVFRTLHWIDTYRAVIAMYLTFNLPYVVWMMRGFFAEVPVELEESAIVDGAGYLRVFWRIAIPLARNGIIVTTVFCLVFSWTEFLFALVLTRTQVVTLPVFMTGLFGQYVQWGEASALSVLMSIPMFIVSLTLSRNLARGLTLGAIK